MDQSKYAACNAREEKRTIDSYPQSIITGVLENEKCLIGVILKPLNLIQDPWSDPRFQDENPDDGPDNPYYTYFTSMVLRYFFPTAHKIGDPSIFATAIRCSVINRQLGVIMKFASSKEEDEFVLRQECSIAVKYVNRFHELTGNFTHTYGMLMGAYPFMHTRILLMFQNSKRYLAGSMFQEYVGHSITYGKFMRICSVAELAQVIHQIITVLNVVWNERNVVHNDLHPGNILIQIQQHTVGGFEYRFRIRIIDYGTLQVIDDDGLINQPAGFSNVYDEENLTNNYDVIQVIMNTYSRILYPVEEIVDRQAKLQLLNDLRSIVFPLDQKVDMYKIPYNINMGNLDNYTIRHHYYDDQDILDIVNRRELVDKQRELKKKLQQSSKRKGLRVDIVDPHAKGENVDNKDESDQDDQEIMEQMREGTWENVELLPEDEIPIKVKQLPEGYLGSIYRVLERYIKFRNLISKPVLEAIRKSTYKNVETPRRSYVYQAIRSLYGFESITPDPLEYDQAYSRVRKALRIGGILSRVYTDIKSHFPAAKKVYRSQGESTTLKPFFDFIQDQLVIVSTVIDDFDIVYSHQIINEIQDEESSLNLQKALTQQVNMIYSLISSLVHAAQSNVKSFVSIKKREFDLSGFDAKTITRLMKEIDDIRWYGKYDDNLYCMLQTPWILPEF